MTYYGIPITADSVLKCEQCGMPYRYGDKAKMRRLCLDCGQLARQAGRYNLTAPDMKAMIDMQENACALCGIGPTGSEVRSYWHIDHDHNCCWPSDAAWAICGGCVRGLLCTGCNSRGVAWYELLPEGRKDWERMNAYLANPPAQRLRQAGVLRYRLPYMVKPSAQSGSVS